jgi:hypothetical protein
MSPAGRPERQLDLPSDRAHLSNRVKVSSCRLRDDVGLEGRPLEIRICRGFYEYPWLWVAVINYGVIKGACPNSPSVAVVVRYVNGGKGVLRQYPIIVVSGSLPRA